MLRTPDRVRSPLGPGEILVAGTWVAKRGWLTTRDHGSPEWQLLCTVRGEGRLRHAGADIALATTRVVVIPAGVAHALTIAPHCRRWEVIWVQFPLPPAWRELLTGRSAADSILKVALVVAQDRRLLLEVLAALLLHSQWPEQSRLLACQLELLVLMMARLRSEERRDPRIRLVLDLLAREDRVPTSREILAHATSLSPARLSTLFHRDVGISLPAYRERMRMRRAMALLAVSDAGVAEVAQALGYSDASYFSGRFRRATGLPPGRWRSAGNPPPPAATSDRG